MTRTRALVTATLAAALVFAAPPRPATATTVLRQSVTSLTRGSSAVVRGRVEIVEGHVESPGHPFRLARVRVLETVAGTSDAVIFVRLLGGTDARGRTWLTPGSPDLAAGDEVLLFLERVPEAVTRRPAVAAAALHAPPDLRGRAEPATGPPPVVQWTPVSLAVGAYHVVRSGADVRAARDPGARGLRQVGDPGAPAAPDEADLQALLASVRAAAAPRGAR